MSSGQSNPMSPPARVSIIIAAYNAEHTVAKAVLSALEEPEVTEVFVVDDASSDNTLQAATSVDDGSGRLKLLTQPINCGPAAARNRALKESSGDWIGILDSDDFFLPGRIQGLLSHSENVDFVADDIWQVTEEAADGPRKSLLENSLTHPQIISFEEFVSSNVTQRGRPQRELGFIKPLMRRSFLMQHGLKYQDNMRLGEDYELYARSLAAGARLRLIAAQGYVSILRCNSLSGQHSTKDLLHFRECDEALMKISTLSKKERDALRRHYLNTDCRLQWRLLIDAVKDKKAFDVLQTFCRPWPVPFYLSKQIVEQASIRSRKKLGLPE